MRNHGHGKKSCNTLTPSLGRVARYTGKPVYATEKLHLVAGFVFLSATRFIARSRRFLKHQK